ncbi:hypothetical protein Tco_1031396 [Tanacetum coccineum]|uniref:Uncharacterized protein n=1 Tax=Tanacetum coccineum TaxID=301880 RepID=A0ABQ5G8V4_9ASTR
MAGVDIDTLTMEQYLALSRENQAPGVVKPKIEGNVNFKIKSQFMRELKEDSFSGNKDEDAHDLIDRVLIIVGLFNIPRVTKDALLDDEENLRATTNFMECPSYQQSRSYNVEEEYAREIDDPYSIRFDEYNRVFKNEIEHLSNEYILRIGKKWYVLEDVWENCQQNYKKTNEAWHDEAYEEDEMWRIREEKTDYYPPYVNIETFEAMIRKELEGHKIQKLGGNYRDRLDSYSFGNLVEFAVVTA